MHWITKVSIVLLNAHLAMLPRLSAEESLLQIRVRSIGRVPESSARAQVDQWESAAKGSLKAIAATKPTMPEMSPEVRALMGLEAPGA